MQRIVDLAKTGISRAKIAERIGGLSRSAVCGILARRGMRAPAKAKKAKPAAKRCRAKPGPAKGTGRSARPGQRRRARRELVRSRHNAVLHLAATG